MDFGSFNKQKRREQRIRMVLPLRVSPRDASDAQFEELAHTLDVTPHGARLGAIRHQLKMGRDDSRSVPSAQASLPRGLAEVARRNERVPSRR